jgi:HEAT repeat protein
MKKVKLERKLGKQKQKQVEAVVHVLVMDTTAVDDTIHIAKLYALSDLPPDLFDQFAAGWPTLPTLRREQISRHLADITEESFEVDFSLLFALMLKDSAPAVRRAALDGLWDSTEITLIPFIIEMMQMDPAEEVQVAATAALGHYVLMAEWGEIVPTASKPIVLALLAELDKPDLSFALRRAALEAVASSGHGRVPELIQTAYASRNEQIRLSAVYAMGMSADRRWLSTVLNELDSDDTEMRIEAARAAGWLAASDAVDKLAEMVWEDEDLEVQITAVQALGKIGGEQVMALLHQFEEEADEAWPEELLDAIEEAMDEAGWLGDDFALDMFDIDEGLEPRADADDDDEGDKERAW